MRGWCVFFFKQKTAYEITVWLEFRRVLFRSALILSNFSKHSLSWKMFVYIVFTSILFLSYFPVSTINTSLTAMESDSDLPSISLSRQCSVNLLPPISAIGKCLFFRKIKRLVTYLIKAKKPLIMNILVVKLHIISVYYNSWSLSNIEFVWNSIV